MQKIAVFRALQLGDMLCSIPALRALRNGYPHALISLIGLPWAHEFVDRFHTYIDSFIPFPGFPGLPEQQYKEEKIVAFINSMQQQRFDLVIQMHGNGSLVNPLMCLFHAKKVAGFYRKGNYCPNPDSFLEFDETVSEVKRLVDLIRFIHIPVQNISMEFPLTENDKQHLFSLQLFQEIKNKDYICIHPGARDTQRRWDPKFFAYVADVLAQKGYQIVFTGTKNETHLISTISSLMQHSAKSFAGLTSLGETAVLLKYSKLLISNCTGVSHLADALHIPSIAVYVASDPQRWAPINTTLHKRIIGKDIESPMAVIKEATLLLDQRLPLLFGKGVYI